MRQSLIAAYEDSPSMDRGILQLMSIIYDGVNKTALMDYVRQCNLPAFKDGNFSQVTLTEVINRLMRKNLIVKGERSQLHCHFLMLEEATRRSVKGGHFEAMAQSVQKKRRSVLPGNSLYFVNYNQTLSELRIAFHRGDMPRVKQILSTGERFFPREFVQYPPWLLVFNNPLCPDEMWTLPDDLISEALTMLFT
ncbi:MAG: hypothetical protein V2I48_12535, partial [Xanthomonadales bacterium]|nr:hypothetical protein [Xanthomonadales bacterium]